MILKIILPLPYKVILPSTEIAILKQFVTLDIFDAVLCFVPFPISSSHIVPAGGLKDVMP